MNDPDFPPSPIRAVCSRFEQPALVKAASLDTDAIIFDLEDSVAPDVKEDAREALREYFLTHPQSKAERVVRINSLASEWGAEDLLAARACSPDAILLPKVETPQDITGVAKFSKRPMLPRAFVSGR